MSDATPLPNAEQIEYWNEVAGKRWIALREKIDGFFTAITKEALDSAAPAAGESVLDVGCGCGTTVLEIGRRIGSTGSVTGVDVSRPMLDFARERVRDEHLENVTLRLADASTFAFERNVVDLVFSRFGVMFFDDPVRAFANIRSAVRARGRLAFLAWRTLKENPWFTVPLNAAMPHLPPFEPPDPNAPGPFAFADAERVRGILKDAGFTAIEIEPRNSLIKLGGPNDLERTAHVTTQLGPIARLFTNATPIQQDAVKTAVLAALKDHNGTNGVQLAAAFWLVSALSP